ncbi:hypothetical protein VTK73DRAFT_8876 [Phialemonium thermophilum]|uniref:Secreted protein n=1 Tax=Phialemonium thermophilum TaxID=223376 RepID=A0ABR3W5S3_9PEZI
MRGAFTSCLGCLLPVARVWIPLMVLFYSSKHISLSFSTRYPAIHSFILSARLNTSVLCLSVVFIGPWAAYASPTRSTFFLPRQLSKIFQFFFFFSLSLRNLFNLYHLFCSLQRLIKGGFFWSYTRRPIVPSRRVGFFGVFHVAFIVCSRTNRRQEL